MNSHARLVWAAWSFFAVALPLGRAYAAEVSFADSFVVSGPVEEAGAMSESASPDWWVNSGGRLVRSGGLGGTVQGDLAASTAWARAYAASNPVDTDGGIHPQNLFRLITRRTWTSFRQSAWFRIRRTQMSDSPNRNASNGLLFFQRYQDANNLYYAGLRVDGAAVVKKKQGGTYTTLGSVKVYPGTYDRAASPNLLPFDRWIGLKAVIVDRPDGSVRIRLKLNDPTLGSRWRLILEAIDTGATIRRAGFAGIRTDFMDVELDDYQAVPKSG